MVSVRYVTSWVLSRIHRRLADAFRHFGNLYGDRSEHMAAVEHYTRAVIHDPDYALAFYSRGLIYWRELGDHGRAIQDLTRVIELDPGCAEAWLNRGLAYKLCGETENAIADLERYLQEGTDAFWLEAALRQLDELGDEAMEPHSHMDQEVES